MTFHNPEYLFLLLALTEQDFENLANAAYHRGLIVFLNAGGVKEVRFARAPEGSRTQSPCFV